jgi:catechol-2,3-dioxygenase
MAVVVLNHYNLRASREVLEQIRDWYRDIVGLEVGPRPPFRNQGFWLYARGHPVLHLSEADPGEAHPVPGAGTFDHVAFTCDDFAAMMGRIERAAEPFRIADVPLTQIRQVFLRDPGGNGVELNFELKDIAAP